MTEYPLSDPLLLVLREERPTTGNEDDRVDSRAALAVLDRVLSVDRFGAVPTDNSIPPRHAQARRRALAGAAVALIAAAAAGGFALADTNSGPNRGHASIILAAKRIAYRTTAAITNALGTGVEQVHSVVASNSGAPVLTIDDWSFGTTWRTELLSARGAPIRDEWTSVAKGIRSEFMVNYLDQSWYETSDVPVSVTPPMVDAGAVAQAIREELNAGDLVVVSQHATINGQSAIELSGTIPFRVAAREGLLSLSDGGGAGGPESVSFTIWIDPTTYLPLQRDVQLDGGATDTSTMTWLPATNDNLIQLRGTIPAGFSQGPTPSQAAGNLGDLPSGNSGEPGGGS